MSYEFIDKPGNAGPDLTKPKGFTLIEVIAVLSLIGILTFVALNRSGFDAEVYGDAEILKNHLRYAQIKSMNSDKQWGINFSGGTYTLEDESANLATLPGEMPTSSTFSSTVDPLMFDQRGRPGDGASLAAAAVIITVSKGSSALSVTVTPNTGFIP